MIASILIAAMLAAADPPADRQLDRTIMLCRIALEEARRGNLDWLEHKMERAGISEQGRTNQRHLCMIYMRGFRDGNMVAKQ